MGAKSGQHKGEERVALEQRVMVDHGGHSGPAEGEILCDHAAIQISRGERWELLTIHHRSMRHHHTRIMLTTAQ